MTYSKELEQNFKEMQGLRQALAELGYQKRLFLRWMCCWRNDGCYVLQFRQWGLCRIEIFKQGSCF